MKIYSVRYFLLVLFACCFTCSCKQEFQQPQQFGTVLFNNQSGVSDLEMSYNDEPYTNGNLLGPVKMPAGKGMVSFTDTVNHKVLLDTLLSIEPGSNQELVILRTTEEGPLALVQNNQGNEPQPEAGFMKVKVANFATRALPDAISLVFYALDDNIYDFVPIDTLEQVFTQFPDGYITLKTTTSVNDPSLMVKPIDANTKEPLTEMLFGIDNYDWSSGKAYSVFTIYLKDDMVNGLPVTGSSHKVDLKTLFKN